jgi:hypothetical protein
LAALDFWLGHLSHGSLLRRRCHRELAKAGSWAVGQPDLNHFPHREPQPFGGGVSPASCIKTGPSHRLQARRMGAAEIPAKAANRGVDFLDASGEQDREWSRSDDVI